jgi:glycosyltransferase involved in cell wall biosynthesis
VTRLKEIHIFEPTGYAGIFQHSCQLAQNLSAQPDLRVVLHTSRQHEAVSAVGVEICRCTWWPRQGNRSSIVKTAVKRATIAGWLLLVTLPHLLLSMSRDSVLHLQGPGASSVINVLILWAARLRRCRVVYSPHDTFSRRGPMDDKLQQLVYQPAHAVMVYSQADRVRLKAFGSRVHTSPLIQQVPQPSNEQILAWRREWNADEPGTAVVLCAGFLRPDKRLDLLIESARAWPDGRRLAVVGEDRGAWAQCAELAEEHNVHIASRIDFIGLAEFAAAIAAADLVVVPAEQASQSGVLALARRLGTPSVAADVGGMGELASRTFTAGTVDDLTAAIHAELDTPSAVGPLTDDQTAVESHLRAYGRPA